MKIKIATLTFGLTLFFSLPLFAACGRCYVAQTPCINPCPFDTVCECTDPGVKHLDYGCLDRCTFCEAFGNVGAR